MARPNEMIEEDDLVVHLADEYLARLRNNEQPTVDEYCARHPSLADRIGSYLPVVALMESAAAHNTRPKHQDGTHSRSGIASPPTKIELEAGTTFGRYDIITELGRGAMGAVYLARDRKLGRNIALKLAHIEPNDNQAVRRFEREANAIATTNHRHICSIFDVDEHDGRHFLTMEFIEGETLAAKLDRGVAFSSQEAAELVRKIANAVQAANDAGIVHRDLKPSNIMVDHNNEPVVLDFGLARSSTSDDADLTQSGAILGSPAYMSPEQVVADHHRVGPATDVYALGVLLYQTLCGRKPFDGSSYFVMKQIESAPPTPPSSICDGVDKQLEAICLRAMSKRIEDRYASAADFAADVAAYARVSLPPVGKTTGKRWIIAAVIAVLVAAVVLPAARSLLPDTTTGEFDRKTNSEGDSARIATDAPGEPVRAAARMKHTPIPIATSQSSAHFVSVGEPIGGKIRAVELGDLDGDGDLDALLARNRARLMVMLNNGSGQFIEGPFVDDPDSYRDWELAIGDVDADGDLDAFVTRNGYDKLWLNDGDAHFTLSAFDFGKAESNQARFGDVDSDGDLDLFVAQNGRCVLWVNDGFGRFADTGQQFGDEYYCGCALGDLNGDGSLDIFVGTVESTSQVWLNNGVGTFEDSKQTIEALAVWDVTLADWESDGDLDAFVSNHEGPNAVWLNDGEGIFSLGQQGSMSRNSVGLCVADLDGDTDLDLLESNADDGDRDTLWLNDGEQLFGTRITLPVIDAQRWALGDVDNDGDIDIFADRVWLNSKQLLPAQRALLPPAPLPSSRSKGEFADSGQRLGNSESVGVAIGDLDGDGDLDAVVGNRIGQPNRVWMNDGAGNFVDSEQLLGQADTGLVSLGDFDGDGDLDAIAPNNDVPNQIWQNDGKGNFAKGQGLEAVNCHHVAIGDLDNDGDLDLFFSCVRGANVVWLKDSHGRFVDTGQRLGQETSHHADLGDVDGDGDLDAFVCNHTASDRVWLNDGRGGFQDSGQELSRGISRTSELVDIDFDGDLDVVVACFQGSIELWRNDARGKFSHAASSHTNGWTAARVADLDGDGNLDVAGTAVHQFGGASCIWLNDKNDELFSKPFQLGLGFTQDVAVGDLDGDGDIDLFQVNMLGEPNRVWLNQSNASAIKERSALCPSLRK